MADNNDYLIQAGEEIIEICKPKSLASRIVSFFQRRVSLIITTERVIYRGPFKINDKEIDLKDIRNIFINGNELRIIKIGAHADYQDRHDTFTARDPYITVNWLRHPTLGIAEKIIKNELKMAEVERKKQKDRK